MKQFLFFNNELGECYYVITKNLECAYNIICNYFGTEYTANVISYEGEMHNE